MVDSDKHHGLFCPKNGTLYVCPHTEVKFVGCCTSDPCKDGSGNCPASDLLAATFDADKLPQDLSQECLGGEWYACPDLEIPFVGCCLRDACQARCPVDDLQAAVLGDDNGLVFKMAGAESAGDSASKGSTATTPATSTSEAKHTASSHSVIPTITNVPTGTTAGPSPAETTVPIPSPHSKDGLSDSQEVGIGVTAGVIGLIVVGCIAHKIIIHIRKRRPGYPHRTDHAPDWHPPSSPIALNSVIAPGTRKCGLDRVPGEATRPGSWEDENNNAAEARLTGLPGPRRVRSAEPGALLNSTATSAFDQGNEQRQVSQHSLPLPDVRGQPTDSSRNAGGAVSRTNKQHRPQGWVTGKELGKNNGHHSDNGDYVVNVNGYGRGSSIDAHARSAHSVDELRRHTAPYLPAARSENQLNHLSQHPLKTYKAYTPLDGPSRRQGPNGMNNTERPREVFELAAEPVGKITDPRARVTLGEVCVLNPDPRESVMIGPEEVKYKIKVSGDKSPDLKEREKKQAIESGSASPAAAIETTNSQLSAPEAASILRSMATSGSMSKPAEENDISDEPPVLGPPVPGASSSEEVPRLDATGGLPSLSPDKSRPTSTASMSFVMSDAQKVDANVGQSDVLSEVTRPSSVGGRVFSTMEDSQCLTAAGDPPASSSSTLATSLTSPTSLSSQQQGQSLREPNQSNMPPSLAVPRRQTSELHMNIPANDGRPPRRSATQWLEDCGLAPFDGPRQHQGRYLPPSGRDDSYGTEQGGHYGGRYQTYPATQGLVQLNHNNREALRLPELRPSNELRTASHQPHHRNYSHSGQNGSQTRQPYVQAHHTRVYYPHRAHHPRTRAQAPNTSRPRRTAEELGLGPQPQPAYRSFEGAQDLNLGNDISRRDLALPGPAYRPGAYFGAVAGGYGTAGSQYAPSGPRSEYSESWDDDQTYGRGSTTSSQRDEFFSVRPPGH